MSKIDGCYDGTNVLVNKKNIKDEEKLKYVEGQITSLQVHHLMNDEALNGKLDYNHLKKMHKTLFDELYDWAGQERKVNISKNTMFCEVRNLPTFANDIFSKLKKNNYYHDLDQEKFIDEMVNLYADLNCLHPFREGNGRTNKLFIQYVAGCKGLNFDFDSVPKDYWNKASEASIYGQTQYLKKCFENSVIQLDLKQTNFYRQACGMKLIKEQSKPRVFFDMDGTLTVWNNVAFEQLLEKGYFKNSKPQMNVIEAAKELQKSGQVEVFILSAVLDPKENPYALDEKNEWLDKYLPEIDKEHRIFPPCGEPKTNYIEGGIDESDVLIDDYNTNLNVWHPPGTGVKLLNGINDIHQSWQYSKISRDKSGIELASDILNILDGQMVRDEMLYGKLKQVISKEELQQINLAVRINHPSLDQQKAQEFVTNKCFEFNGEEYYIHQYGKMNSGQTQAVIENLKTNEVFLQKNFLSEKAFKLDFSKPLDKKEITNNKDIKNK